MRALRVAILFTLLAAYQAPAQGSDQLDWKITPYLWGINLDGTMAVGRLEQDVNASFSDILSNMDFGASLIAEVGKGKHAVHFDYSYLRLKPDPTEFESPPFPPGSELKSKLTVNIFETGYNYRLDGYSLVFGARYMDLNLKMTPVLTGPGPIDPDPLQAGPSWWDAFVGIKTHNEISANWDFDFYGTVGAGQSDWPWTLQAMFARRFSNNNRLGLGVRIWSIDYSNNKNEFEKYSRIDTRIYGFLIGYEFN